MTLSTSTTSTSTNCQQELMALGKLAPRTCVECGLGPCNRRTKSTQIVNTGWLCPACGRGNAPLNMTCPCKGWPKMEVSC